MALGKEDFLIAKCGMILGCKYEHKLRVVEAKLEKLKQLVLLVDPAVSDVTMNDLTIKQWLEFVKSFPDEDTK